MSEDNINISYKIIEDTSIAEKANSISEDIFEFVQTSVILTEFRNIFGRNSRDYSSRIKNKIDQEIISCIIKRNMYC